MSSKRELKTIVWATHRGHIGGKEYCWKVPAGFEKIYPGDILIAETEKGDKSIYVTRVATVYKYPMKDMKSVVKKLDVHMTEKTVEKAKAKRDRRLQYRLDLIIRAYEIRTPISIPERIYISQLIDKWYGGYQVTDQQIQDAIEQTKKACKNVDFNYTDKLLRMQGRKR